MTNPDTYSYRGHLTFFLASLQNTVPRQLPVLPHKLNQLCLSLTFSRTPDNVLIPLPTADISTQHSSPISQVSNPGHKPVTSSRITLSFSSYNTSFLRDQHQQTILTQHSTPRQSSIRSWTRTGEQKQLETITVRHLEMVIACWFVKQRHNIWL